jgi:hypothetical protein
MTDIMWLATGLAGGIIFTIIQNFVLKKFQKKVVETIPEDVRKNLIDLYNKGVLSAKELAKKGLKLTPEESGCVSPSLEKECFNSSKLKHGALNITDPVLWVKDFIGIFNIRKLLIYGVIIGAIFGYGYFKGVRNAPVKVDLGHGQEAKIKLDGHWLHITKEGAVHVQKNYEDIDQEIIKVISVKDLPALYAKLKPYGFRLKPFVCAGGSIGDQKAKFEGGAGVDFFKWFKWNANVWLTNGGAYLGVGYNITDNFDILAGVGKAWQEGNLLGLFGKWKF